MLTRWIDRTRGDEANERRRKKVESNEERRGSEDGVSESMDSEQSEGKEGRQADEG